MTSAAILQSCSLIYIPLNRADIHRVLAHLALHYAATLVVGSCCAGDLAALTYHLAFHPSNHCTLHPHQSNRRFCLTSAYPTSLLSVSHAQHVNAKRGRRAAAHQLAQLFVRTPHLAIVEYSSPEDPVRADYRSTCKQPTAVSSCWVSRCCTNHGTGRRAGAAGAVSFAALC